MAACSGGSFVSGVFLPAYNSGGVSHSARCKKFMVISFGVSRNVADTLPLRRSTTFASSSPTRRQSAYFYRNAFGLRFLDMRAWKHAASGSRAAGY